MNDFTCCHLATAGNFETHQARTLLGLSVDGTIEHQTFAKLQTTVSDHVGRQAQVSTFESHHPATPSNERVLDFWGGDWRCRFGPPFDFESHTNPDPR